MAHLYAVMSNALMRAMELLNKPSLDPVIRNGLMEMSTLKLAGAEREAFDVILWLVYRCEKKIKSRDTEFFKSEIFLNAVRDRLITADMMDPEIKEWINTTLDQFTAGEAYFKAHYKMSELREISKCLDVIFTNYKEYSFSL